MDTRLSCFLRDFPHEEFEFFERHVNEARILAIRQATERKRILLDREINESIEREEKREI